MGKVVTIMNMKGGVGKTTVCMHIGGILARYGLISPIKKQLRVLLIDYDPQFNMSQAMLRSRQYFNLEKDSKTCLQILQEPGTVLNPFKIQTPDNTTPPKVSDIAQAVVSKKNGAQLDLVVSTLDLMYIALGTATGDVETIEARFEAFINKSKPKYDLVMIDCHPAGSILTRTSLRNSDHVLIPVAPQAYAARGIALMIRFIDANKTEQHKLEPHILFNLVPRSGPAPKVVKEITTDEKLGPLCLSHKLIKYSAFSEPTEGTGFVWSSGKPYSTEAFSNLLGTAREFAKTINL